MIEASQSATSTNTPGHCRSRLEQILHPTIDGRVAANVAGWEKNVRSYEAITSKKLGEDVRTAMLTKLASKPMHMRLQLDAAHLSKCHARDCEGAPRWTNPEWKDLLHRGSDKKRFQN